MPAANITRVQMLSKVAKKKKEEFNKNFQQRMKKEKMQVTKKKPIIETRHDWIDLSDKHLLKAVRSLRLLIRIWKEFGDDWDSGASFSRLDDLGARL